MCFGDFGLVLAQCHKWMLYSNSVYHHPFNCSHGVKHVMEQKTKDKADKAGSSEQFMLVECSTEVRLLKCELPSIFL